MVRSADAAGVKAYAWGGDPHVSAFEPGLPIEAWKKEKE
jgi:hypothetical protein